MLQRPGQSHNEELLLLFKADEPLFGPHVRTGALHPQPPNTLGCLSDSAPETSSEHVRCAGCGADGHPEAVLTRGGETPTGKVREHEGDTHQLRSGQGKEREGKRLAECLQHLVFGSYSQFISYCQFSCLYPNLSCVCSLASL